MFVFVFQRLQTKNRNKKGLLYINKMPTIILQFIYTTQGSLFVLCFIFGHSMQVILFCSLNHNIQNHIIGFYFQLLFLQIYVTRQKNKLKGEGTK